MRRAARTDTMHAPVREAFRKLGYSWHDTFQLGGGFADGIASGAALGSRNILVEVKTGKEDLTPDEKKFHRDWPGEIVIVRSVEQVILLDAIWRNGVKKEMRDGNL